jgi:hypothetical protein
MAWNNNYEPQENKLAFRDWKVFIDNSSQWFDEINKKISKCYIETNYIKLVYPEIRSFTSSRKANLSNFYLIDSKLKQVKEKLYSRSYNELKKDNVAGDLDNKILEVLDKIVQLLSEGMSDGELIPKNKDIRELPYELEGNAKDGINKALTNTNNSSIGKNGTIRTN